MTWKTALCLTLLLLPAAGRAEEPDWTTLQTTATRFGSLVVLTRRDSEGTQLSRLALDDLKITELAETESLWVGPVVRGKGKDYALVFVHDGGSGCPGHYLIAEITGPAQVKTSKAFGDCANEGAKARLSGDSLIVEIPAYIPHPDLLPPKELKKREKQVDVYTWRGGKLSSPKKAD